MPQGTAHNDNSGLGKCTKRILQNEYVAEDRHAVDVYYFTEEKRQRTYQKMRRHVKAPVENKRIIQYIKYVTEILDLKLYLLVYAEMCV